MWFLRRPDGTVYPLYTKSEHIIGRFGTLELADDDSVSRKHASIVITLKDGRAKFILKDLGSKYGTFLNDDIESSTALPKTTPIEIHIGDRIKFGLQSNIWKVEESRFITCTSMLTSYEKSTTLKGILDRIGGEIIYDWNTNCTHLTMTQIRTTIKVVCAAAQVKPIVTPEYWKHLATIFSRSVETPLPNCDDFLPPIVEPLIKSSLISMKMNKNRRTIFEGFKVIVFNDAQMKNISPVVEATGGTVIDGNRRTFKINETELCKDKVIIIEDADNEPSARITRIKNILNSQKMRLIREMEIYLSIFECSTKRHCNPKYDISVLLFPSDSEIFVKEEPEVLVDATQDILSLQETQFLETASGSFALEVNDRLESDDDDIIPGTDPSIISGTPDLAAPKRKLPIIENVVKRKSARLDDWLLNKKQSNDNGESLASESVFPSSSSKTKKGFKELFSFRATKKETNKASSSLFSSNNNSSPQIVSTPKGNESVSRTSSLFASATNKPSEAGDQKVSRTAGLFANVGAPRATRSSSNLFSGSQEPSTSKNTSAGKRKREDEVDSGSKSGSRTATLFEKRVKRPSAVIEVPDSDSTDDFDSIPRKTFKLDVVENAPMYQDSPVDVPCKMSLSQFQSPPAKENVTLVKTEDVSPIKDTLDKSVVHTMPLVLSDNASNVRRSTNTSVTNFKKFRKNQVSYPTPSLPNIMKLTLFCGGEENGFHDD